MKSGARAELIGAVAQTTEMLSGLLNVLDLATLGRAEVPPGETLGDRPIGRITEDRPRARLRGARSSKAASPETSDGELVTYGMASPARFELAAPRLGGECSIP